MSSIWVPMAGRRMWNKFLIENIGLFEKELPEYKKYVFVYVEPLDLTEESLAGYLRLIGKSFLVKCGECAECKKLVDPESNYTIFDDEKATYGRLLETLKSCFSKAAGGGFQIVLFLGEFDELSFANMIFFNNLKSLWDSLKPKLHYVFLSVTDLATAGATSKFGELNAVTLQNLVYAPVLGEDDVNYLVGYFGDQFNYDFSSKEADLIRELCGGHPYLIKCVSRIISQIDGGKKSIEEIRKIVVNHYEPVSVARRIFELRNSGEQEILGLVSSGREVPDSSELATLVKLGLVKKDPKGRNRPFGELMGMVASGKNEAAEPDALDEGKRGGVGFDVQTGTISYRGIPIEEKFTRQEYLIMKLFLAAPNKLFSRDDIGDTLWGKQSYDKYSDWAIDQLMSKLRKKLEQLGMRASLITVKGRGYKFTS